MADYCELELALGWRKQGVYSLAMRYTDPDSDTDVRLLDPVEVPLDPAKFSGNGVDVDVYGHELTQSVLGDAGLREAFGKARAAAQAKNRNLRVRLFLSADALDLHRLRWETLHDPSDDSRLLTKDDVLFSRYLSSVDWRPVPVRSKAALRALVVIADPSDLAKYAPNGEPLAPIDVAGELERARTGLGSIECETLAQRGEATVDRIAERLREGFDILYLVCHGAKIDDVPKLWLEKADGTADRVFGKDLVNRLQDMLARPRLIVLASCQSAGTGTSTGGDVLSAIGPRLAEAGIPAVLAMQGNISMETVAKFMPAFFRELDRDGQVDRAMSVARAAVRERPDWWMPALFMRLRSGRLWFDQGFGGASGGGFDRLEAVCTDIRDKKCIPILGPGLVESMLGSLREIARRWADRYDFPLAPHNREELAQVAQFLAYRQSRSFPRMQLREYLKEFLISRYRDRLPGDLIQKPTDDNTLNEMISAIGKSVRAEHPQDVHAALARMDFPVYVTANRDNLLFDALEEAGKRPRMEIARWKKGKDWPKSPFEVDPNYEPSKEEPLVLHLFGNIKCRDSVVLTEDDYFDFLIGVTRGQQAQQRPPIPLWVSSRLASWGLLFLGFQMDDWDFRILYRSVVNQEGGDLAEDHLRVAVQINPSEGRILEPLGARTYLERYFQKTRDYGVYWGSVDEFMAEL